MKLIKNLINIKYNCKNQESWCCNHSNITAIFTAHSSLCTLFLLWLLLPSGGEPQMPTLKQHIPQPTPLPGGGLAFGALPFKLHEAQRHVSSLLLWTWRTPLLEPLPLLQERKLPSCWGERGHTGLLIQCLFLQITFDRSTLYVAVFDKFVGDK